MKSYFPFIFFTLILAPLASYADGVEEGMGFVYNITILIYNIPALGALLFLFFSKGEYKKALIFNGLIWVFYTILIITSWNSFTGEGFWDKTILNPYYGPITSIFILTIVLYEIRKYDKYSE